MLLTKKFKKVDFTDLTKLGLNNKGNFLRLFQDFKNCKEIY